jgi:hypothetical protein
VVSAPAVGFTTQHPTTLPPQTHTPQQSGVYTYITRFVQNIYFFLQNFSFLTVRITAKRSSKSLDHIQQSKVVAKDFLQY